MGWAYTDEDCVDPSNSGAVSFATKRHENKGMRFVRFRQFLEKITFGLHCEDEGDEPKCIIYYEEVVFHRGASAAHVYGGWLAIMHSFCDERNIPYSGVPIGTIKKRATNSGRAAKEDMIRAARQSWGQTMTHDQADAAWVLQCGIDEIYGRRYEDESDRLL